MKIENAVGIVTEDTEDALDFGVLRLSVSKIEESESEATCLVEFFASGG